jgi:hypothetical protein
LDGINHHHSTDSKKYYKSFTFDFKALYDSLDPSLVLEALSFAMQECRPDWTEEFRKWVIALVEFSLKASVGVFEKAWYIQKKGVPTGGSLCVQIANITVFYIMQKVVYSNLDMMRGIASLKRYIDDGAGHFVGSKREFASWLNEANRALAPFGLNIDESSIEDPGKYVAFLDIKFCFDTDGVLQTDLHTKETDARSYLNFSSAHPPHVYSGIVYSQCLRLRRIINCEARLKLRLAELRTCFMNAQYPASMVDNITKKVSTVKRDIYLRSEKNEMGNHVKVVSAFGSDSDLLASVKKFEPDLSRTRSFSFNGIGTENSEANFNNVTKGKPPDTKIFSFIKKTGSSLRNKLVKTKNLALGKKYGPTHPCRSKNCALCEQITDQESFTINGKVVKSAPGCCFTYNVIYLVMCKLCFQAYVGRTTQHLRTRIGQHRRKFYAILNGCQVDPLDDENALGIHLTSVHGLTNRTDFNDAFRVCIIDNCSPRMLEIKEHKFIHILNTLRPNGMNIQNPFGIPPFLY